MSAKRYDEQFKRDAVAFYEDNLGLSLQQASSDLGIHQATLHGWVKALGTGKRSRTKRLAKQAQEISDAQRIRVLEKEIARLREEREILQKAMKYFAAETNW